MSIFHRYVAKYVRRDTVLNKLISLAGGEAPSLGGSQNVACSSTLSADMEPVHYHEEASLVCMIDISGYSTLTALLAERCGKLGSEIITETVGKYLSQIIDIIDAAKGDVVKFLGDAMLVKFSVAEITKDTGQNIPPTAIKHVVDCCLEILSNFHDYAVKFQAPQYERRSSIAFNSIQEAVVDRKPPIRAMLRDLDGYKLNLHIGITGGMVGNVIFGDPKSRLDYLISGPPVTALGSVLSAAVAGELAIECALYSTLLCSYPTFSRTAKVSVTIAPTTIASVAVLTPRRDAAPTTGALAAASTGSFPRPAGSSPTALPGSAGTTTGGVRRGSLVPLMQPPAISPSPTSSSERNSVVALSDAIFTSGNGDRDRLGRRATIVRQPSAVATSALVAFSAGAQSVFAKFINASLAKRMKQSLAMTVSSETSLYHEMSEYRRMTIMFVKFNFPFDLVKVQQAFNACLKGLSKYEGLLQQFSIDDKGTTMLAVFGLPPFTHEHETEFATMCALNIQEALHRSNLVPFTISLATGDTFFSVINNFHRSEAGLLSDVVVIAARLMDLPDTENSVVCDTATKMLTKKLPECFTLIGEFKLKGRPDDTAVWKVARPLVHERAPKKSSFGETIQFIGYKEQKEALLRGFDLWKRNLKPEGACYLIEGGSGMGKTHLLALLQQQCKLIGILTCSMSALEIEKGTANHVIQSLLIQIFVIIAKYPTIFDFPKDFISNFPQSSRKATGMSPLLNRNRPTAASIKTMPSVFDRRASNGSVLSNHGVHDRKNSLASSTSENARRRPSAIKQGLMGFTPMVQISAYSVESSVTNTSSRAPTQAPSRNLSQIEAVPESPSESRLEDASNGWKQSGNSLPVYQKSRRSSCRLPAEASADSEYISRGQTAAPQWGVVMDDLEEEVLSRTPSKSGHAGGGKILTESPSEMPSRQPVTTSNGHSSLEISQASAGNSHQLSRAATKRALSKVHDEPIAPNASARVGNHGRRRSISDPALVVAGNSVIGIEGSRQNVTATRAQSQISACQSANTSSTQLPNPNNGAPETINRSLLLAGTSNAFKSSALSLALGSQLSTLSRSASVNGATNSFAPPPSVAIPNGADMPASASETPITQSRPPRDVFSMLSSSDERSDLIYEIMTRFGETEYLALLNVMPNVSFLDSETTRGLSWAARSRLLADLVSRLVDRVAEKVKLVVMFDGCQWMDAVSEEIVRALVTGKRQKAFIVVATRAGLVGGENPSSILTAGWRKETTIVLNGLNEEDIEDMIQCFIPKPIKSVSPVITHAVYQKCSGHPFFTKLVIEAMMETTSIDFQINNTTGELTLGTSRKEDLDDLLIADIESAVMVRFDRFPPDYQTIVKTAAMLGQCFLVFDLVGVLADERMTYEVVESMLLQHEDHGFIARPPGGGDDSQLVGNTKKSTQSLGSDNEDAQSPNQKNLSQFCFPNLSIRDSIASSMSLAQRQSLNGRIAEYFESTLDDSNMESLIPTITYHYTNSPFFGKAVEFTEALAILQLERSMYLEGILTLERLIEMVEAGGPDVSAAEQNADQAVSGDGGGGGGESEVRAPPPLTTVRCAWWFTILGEARRRVGQVLPAMDNLVEALRLLGAPWPRRPAAFVARFCREAAWFHVRYWPTLCARVTSSNFWKRSDNVEQKTDDEDTPISEAVELAHLESRIMESLCGVLQNKEFASTPIVSGFTTYRRLNLVMVSQAKADIVTALIAASRWCLWQRQPRRSLALFQAAKYHNDQLLKCNTGSEGCGSPVAYLETVAEILHLRGEAEEAMSVASKALAEGLKQSAGGSTAAIAVMAASYQRMGRFTESVQLFGPDIDILSKGVDAARKVAYFSFALQSYLVGNSSTDAAGTNTQHKAMFELVERLKDDPDVYSDITSLLTLCMYYVRSGNHEAATRAAVKSTQCAQARIFNTIESIILTTLFLAHFALSPLPQSPLKKAVHSAAARASSRSPPQTTAPRPHSQSPTAESPKPPPLLLIVPPISTLVHWRDRTLPAYAPPAHYHLHYDDDDDHHHRLRRRHGHPLACIARTLLSALLHAARGEPRAGYRLLLSQRRRLGLAAGIGRRRGRDARGTTPRESPTATTAGSASCKDQPAESSGGGDVCCDGTDEWLRTVRACYFGVLAALGRGNSTHGGGGASAAAADGRAYRSGVSGVGGGGGGTSADGGGAGRVGRAAASCSWCVTKGWAGAGAGDGGGGGAKDRATASGFGAVGCIYEAVLGEAKDAFKEAGMEGFL